MEPRLTRGEYWLLNCVVKAGVPVKLLFDDDVEGAFNKRGRLMDRSRLIETLCELDSKGWIHADREGDPVRLDESAFAEALDPNGGRPLYYRLTTVGGEAWEAFAAPRWDRFLWPLIGFSEKSGSVEGADRDRVDEYVSMVHHFGWCIAENSIVWSELEPYQATYWKTLANGFRCDYKYAGLRERPDWNQVPHRAMSLRRWYEWE